MKEKKYEELMEYARKASKNNYAPYSGFAVGSAVLVKSGEIFYGANIENASYGITNCAERSALYNAFSNGHKDIVAIAVWTEKGETFPCGVCRQAILELAPDADILVNSKDGGIITLSIEDLLPFAYSDKDLKK